MSWIINKVDFIQASGSYQELPLNEHPEIALIGRSNAGKSTFINRLTGRKNIAKTSQKPGKTRSLNLFELQCTYEGQQHNFNLMDLPGYGYAKVSKKMRFALEESIIKYLENREQLHTVLFLSDVRRVLNSEDIAFRDFLFSLGVSTIITLTKCDKLNQKDLHKQVKKNAEVSSLEPADFLLSGSKTMPQVLMSRLLQPFA